MTRPLLVGEAASVSGSRRFRELIEARRWADAVETVLAQVADGAEVLDVSMAGGAIDEVESFVAFLAELSRRSTTPIMVDAVAPDTFAAALAVAVDFVNSANFAGGVARFDRVVELARENDCSLVVGCIDEAGPARDVARKLSLAHRLIERARETHGMAPDRLLVDVLAFPCSSDRPSVAMTIDAVALVKRELPEVRTLLAVSNVSFGLAQEERSGVDALFLERARSNGLDVAIVNCSRLGRGFVLTDDARRNAARLLDGDG